MVISSNINDLKLYEYVLNTIWKEQVKDYNSDKLKSDLIKEFSSKNYRFNERISSNVNIKLNKTYHHFFYKPISKLRYKLK